VTPIDFAKAVRRRAARIANFVPALTPEEASMLSRLKAYRGGAPAAIAPYAPHGLCPTCERRNPLPVGLCEGCGHAPRQRPVLQ
jgi:hypothetical protein